MLRWIRGLSPFVPLLAQPLVLAAQARQFPTLRAGRAAITATGVAIGLLAPLADRRRRWFELPRQLLGVRPLRYRSTIRLR